MEDLLRQFKEALTNFILSSYKVYIFVKDKIIAFIQMLKRVFGKKKKLN